MEEKENLVEEDGNKKKRITRSKVRDKRMVAIGLSIALIIVMGAGSRFFTKEQGPKLTEGILSTVGKRVPEEEIIQLGGPDRIMVIRADGTIMPTGSVNVVPSGVMDIEGIINNLDIAMKDDTIKGVVLEVNSPGGTIYHSEIMRQKILEYKETEKPIYTSMGMVAASGGYYISAPTDKIFASNETMTGSLGVISQYTNLEGLYDKLGISYDTFTSGNFKDMGSGTRPMTEEEAQYAQQMVNEHFNTFVNVIVDGRGMNEERVRGLADGRIYMGSTALKNGLIDEIGYFDDVVESISEDLGITNPTVFEIKYSSYFGGFFGDLIKVNEDDSMDRILKLEDTPLFLYKGGYNGE